MSATTGIGWTDSTWNPLRARPRRDRVAGGVVGTGKVGWCCVKVSPGCRDCYAETINERLGTGLLYTARAVRLVEAVIDEHALVQPLRWRRSHHVFVCSMTDLFGEWVPAAHIDRVFAMMVLARHQIYQVLTKRPERMRRYLSDPDTPRRVAVAAVLDPASSSGHALDAMSVSVLWGGAGPTLEPVALKTWPLPNVWAGVSAEDQAHADERVPHLLATPAARRFVSYEPALGPVDFSPYHDGGVALDWIIVGAESGSSRRRFDLAWLEAVHAHTRAAGVPLFVKQDSAFKPGQRGRIPDHLWIHEFPSRAGTSSAQRDAGSPGTTPAPAGGQATPPTT